MKLKLLLLTLSSLLISKSWALETDVKGFLALDLLALEKVDGRNQTLETGIGVLDMKLYAAHDDFRYKIKLDLDGNLSDQNNLFEEALLSWRPTRLLRLSFGKGKVPFHRMHYGVLESSYIDGGSILGTVHSLRDQDRKILISARIGSYGYGFFNHLTFFGNSQQPERLRDDDTKLYLPKDYSEITYQNSKLFNTKFERGVANKFEWLIARGINFSAAALYFHRDIDPDEDYAFDIGFEYDRGPWEFYAEYVWAHLSKHPNDKYTAKSQEEQIVQVGGEYRFNKEWAVAMNIEAIFVNAQRHDKNDYTGTVGGSSGNNTDPSEYGIGQSFNNDGSKRETDNMKFELGLKHKLTKSLVITGGTVFERKWTEVNDVPQDPKDAYQVSSSLSFWF